MLKQIAKTLGVICLMCHTHVYSQDSALEEWSYSLALQAATWGAPLVIMYTLRAQDCLGPNAKASPNSFWRMEDISTPFLSEQEGYVTPNVNVIYGFGFMDLDEGPIILEVPNSHNRYYMVEIVDMWTNAFAYVGGMATGYGGGKFALVGPHGQASLPPSVKRIDCPTRWVLLQPRVHIYNNGQIDLPGAKKILSQIKVTSLEAYMGKRGLTKTSYNYPLPHLTNTHLPVSALDFEDPLQFWEILSIALNENPPPEEEIVGLLPLFKPLGLELNKVWVSIQIPPPVLTAMRDAAIKIASILEQLPSGHFHQGALIPPPDIGLFGNDYKTRGIIARVGLTANTAKESIYWMYVKDTKGNPLIGKKNYTLTFTKEIPFYKPGFWSITMYDTRNNYTIPNPINRYMLGSDTRDLKRNRDGSITIYIQKDSPGKDKESNWLPSPPGPFYLVPRSYPPTPVLFQMLSDVNAWPIPAVMPVDIQ